MDYAPLRQLARQHREQYNADSLLNAEDEDQNGQFNLAMWSPSTQTRLNNNRADAQAEFNPAWDAFFQAVQGDEETMPAFGSARKKKPATASLSALRALGQ